ncbi:MAG TPA: plastocyanin/azurin family copper-binding protein [Solirubrobacterales bacterium]|nr:plastocyanin/azurin family copper-binding protein [Solirubrobacterales bacterium]
MDNGTLFYIFGGALAASAVVVSLLGLKLKDFPGRLAPLVFVWFAILVGCSTTFAVLHAQDEEHAKAAELAEGGEEAEEAVQEAVDEGGATEQGGEAGAAAGTQGSGPEAKGPGSTLQLAADPTQIAYDKTSLTSKPGKVTIDFDNPAALEHDVAIEQNGKEIAVSETITEGETSVSAELAPGTYTFLCTVPGHAEAGMEGTLTVR